MSKQNVKQTQQWYESQCTLALCHAMRQWVESVYGMIKQQCLHQGKQHVLIPFQKKLKTVKSWPASYLEKMCHEVRRLHPDIQDFFNEYVQHTIHLMVQAELDTLPAHDQQTFRDSFHASFQHPSFSKLVHDCCKAVASRLYADPMLVKDYRTTVHEGLQPSEMIKLRKLLDDRIHEAVVTTMASTLPVSKLLKQMRSLRESFQKTRLAQSAQSAPLHLEQAKRALEPSEESPLSWKPDTSAVSGLGLLKLMRSTSLSGPETQEPQSAQEPRSHESCASDEPETEDDCFDVSELLQSNQQHWQSLMKKKRKPVRVLPLPESLLNQESVPNVPTPAILPQKTPSWRKPEKSPSVPLLSRVIESLSSVFSPSVTMPSSVKKTLNQPREQKKEARPDLFPATNRTIQVTGHKMNGRRSLESIHDL